MKTEIREPRASEVVDHFFRHEYGRVISFLARKFGADQFELVEDAVQEALYKAMQAWPFSGIPANPSGWITKTAQNKLIDELRRSQGFDQKAKQIIDEAEKQQLPDDVILRNELGDDLLKMMFACCRPEINEEYQIILALKILCGFGNKEIAMSLFKTEEAVAKAYLRSKEKLRETGFVLSVPSGEGLGHRLENLLRIIYLLFNEGYKAALGPALVRKDLCLEAIRLTGHILDHPSLSTSGANSLMALMLFQTARFESRINKEGRLQTLLEQDRGLWDRKLIEGGIAYLDRAAQANELTEYYVQASIAAVHCFAPDFKSTDWNAILSLYNILLRINPGKVVALNRIVALARVEGPEKALLELKSIEDEKLVNYYLFHAIKADLLNTVGDRKSATAAYEKASILADNQLEKEYLLSMAQKAPAP